MPKPKAITERGLERTFNKVPGVRFLVSSGFIGGAVTSIVQGGVVYKSCVCRLESATFRLVDANTGDVFF